MWTSANSTVIGSTNQPSKIQKRMKQHLFRHVRLELCWNIAIIPIPVFKVLAISIWVQ